MIPYSLGEAKVVVETHDDMNPYHRELMRYLCRRCDGLEQALYEVTKRHDPDGTCECPGCDMARRALDVKSKDKGGEE